MKQKMNLIASDIDFIYFEIKPSRSASIYFHQIP